VATGVGLGWTPRQREALAHFVATGGATMASVLRVGVGQAVPLQVLNWRSIQAILSLAMGLGLASGSA
jgi:hypothetical protein